MYTEEQLANARQQLALAKTERERIYALLTHYNDKAKSFSSEDIDLLKSYYENLPDLRTEFKQINAKIDKINIVLKPEERIETLQTFVSFMELVSNIEGIYFKFKKTEALPIVQQATPAVNKTAFNNLSKIHIPKYDGDLNSWPNFFALFNSLVHNNGQLDEVSKLQYLKTSLISDAANVVSGFHLTAENYLIAYNALKSRYENKRRIAQMYLNKILEFQPGNSNSLTQLKSFIHVHENSVNALRALNLDNLEDFILLSLALKNLDTKSRQAFEESHNSDVVPPYENLIKFLNQRIRNLENLQLSTDSPTKKPNPRTCNSYIAQSASTSSIRPQSNYECFCCSQLHSIFKCSKFANLSISQKYNLLKKLHRCFRCLGNHLKSDCNSSNVCHKCSSSSHHSLLHPLESSSTSPPPSTPIGSTVNPGSSKVVLTCSSENSNSVNNSQPLLGTFRAFVRDACGDLLPIRGVIDPGSQLSFIKSSLARSLNLPLQPINLQIAGIGVSDTASSHSVTVEIVSKLANKAISLNMPILNSISPQIPSVSFNKNYLKQFRHLRLADPSFNRPDSIDILLGADAFPRIISNSRVSPVKSGPTSLNTIFGWIIIGPIRQTSSNTSHVSLLSTTEVSKQLNKFWEIESVKPKTFSDPLDVIAERHFASTVARNPQGRYIVSLPFHPLAKSLGYNSRKSLNSLERLESRLSKHSHLKDEYRVFMEDYLSSNHMEPALSPSSYVIPHHLVTKETNQGPKVRVVFNASSPDDTGVSLNDRLLKGPKLQSDISNVLLSFRLNTVALCCDIKQMYRQVLIQPEHCQYQHVFWRYSDSSEVKEMQLNTVTYGMAPSAFLAVRVLHKLVEDEGQNYPLASYAIKNNTYVDDIICGAPSLSEAAALQSQLTQLLALGGFQLRKWSSSHPQLLNNLPTDHWECPLQFSDPDRTIKILGLNWEPSSDSFVFRTSPFEGECTKRAFLSYIARIFDPLGYLSPITFSLKSMLQLLWLSPHDWDQPVSSELQVRWNSIVHNFSAISKLSIPRPFHFDSSTQFSLIGFADASQLGYAAIVYLCAHTPASRQSTLWIAKTRVAPIKPLSIPRLELCAAVLLADLVTSLLSFNFPTPLHHVHLFSDSQITLSWIGTPPHLLKTFVANRVSHISDIPFKNVCWSHILSEQNPADMASRGLSPEHFISPQTQLLWFNGPQFINDPSLPWPSAYTSTMSTDSLPEARDTSTVSLVSHSDDNFFLNLLNRFSTLRRAKRVLAWILRFTSNCRMKLSPSRQHGELSPSEIEQASLQYVRATQSFHFSSEIQQLKSQKLVRNLESLSPFLDSVGVVRVGGRLSFSSLPFASKHPILLPKHSSLTTLICKHFHLSSLHAGPNTCMALIRSEYWVLSLRTLIRSIIASCRTCKLFRGQPLQPIMSDLPASRVNPSRPFLTAGVDFAGPFKVKISPLRKSPIIKGYLCLFVCFTTKALHLEFVSELTTVAFIAALDRFIARRGLPHTIYSDRGTNFIGARNHLVEVTEFLKRNQPAVYAHLSNLHVNWVFNPPYAPNFGGLWEAGVKSVKNLLYRITADICFSVEEYFTLFARIEAILNSRPLCPLSNEPHESSNYLSPGHFLIGAPLLSRPEIPPNHKLSLSNRWKAISHLTHQFWQKWSHEYLNTLMQRSKWTRHAPPINVNDVVFLKNFNSSPLNWPIARVISLHPGPDGITRLVTLKNSSGEFLRPVNRLVPLND